MPKFEAFANAVLLKAGDAKTPYKVGGILSTEDRDIDGEILKSVDYSYFLGGFGKIKYEHNEIKGPAAIIGFPTNLVKKGTKTYFEGDLVPFDPEAPETELTPQQRLAKSTVTLLQHMEEFNKNHPEATQQKAGWSVEGEYVAKDNKTGLVKARISDVVFTTKPRNQNTVAYVLKSLETGYGVTPATQTGFGATRKESLEGTEKNHQSKGVRKMKTKESVYKDCLEKGMSRSEAQKEAEKFEKESLATMDETFDKAQKSLASTKTALQKSLDSAKEVLAVEIETDVDSYKTKLKKSLATDDKGQIEDIGKYLQESNNVSLKALELFEKTNEKLDKIAKSLQARAEADIAMLDNSEFTLQSLQKSMSEVLSMKGHLGILAKSLFGKPETIPSEHLSGVNYRENDGALPKDLTKAQKKEVIKGLVAKGELEVNALENFEANGGWMNEKTAALVKSRATEFIK